MLGFRKIGCVINYIVHTGCLYRSGIWCHSSYLSCYVNFKTEKQVCIFSFVFIILNVSVSTSIVTLAMLKFLYGSIE